MILLLSVTEAELPRSPTSQNHGPNERPPTSPERLPRERFSPALHRGHWDIAVRWPDKVQVAAFKIDNMQSDHSTEASYRRQTGLPAGAEENRNAIRCFNPDAKQCFKSQ
ncbi:MAG: hypothetical protein IPJ08_07595 [Burkholderiales bacterium]|nr:hypothetical protein [Burkholderiales bacterium]